MIKQWALDVLACPKCSGKLINAEEGVHCEQCATVYPYQNGILRCVETDNYAESFGFQWNFFKKTQHDSSNEYAHSTRRFKAETGWSENDLSGNVVLDGGCGNGRFTEIALKMGAKVIALDLSDAVETCYANMTEAGFTDDDFLVVQASFYEMPIRDNSLDKAFSLGVLQHTPDPKLSLEKIAALVKHHGAVAYWVYEKNWKMWMDYRYYFRTVTKYLSKNANWKLSQFLTHTFFPFAWFLNKYFGFPGKVLSRVFLPIAFRRVHSSMGYADSKTWTLLDTFDNLSPRYDLPISEKEMFRWLGASGFTDIARQNTPGLAVKALKK